MTISRSVGAEAFSRLCGLTGLSSVDLCGHLEKELARSRQLQPSTLRAWRSGRQAVPVEALLVVAELANFRFPGLEVLLLGEAIDDPAKRRKALTRAVHKEAGRPPAPAGVQVDLTDTI